MSIDVRFFVFECTDGVGIAVAVVLVWPAVEHPKAIAILFSCCCSSIIFYAILFSSCIFYEAVAQLTETIARLTMAGVVVRLRGSAVELPKAIVGDGLGRRGGFLLGP